MVQGGDMLKRAGGNWLVPAVLAAGIAVLAVLFVVRPGLYLAPAVTGVLCFLLAGYAEAQLRLARRARPLAPPAPPEDPWADSLRRLERIVAALGEPLPPLRRGATLH